MIDLDHRAASGRLQDTAAPLLALRVGAGLGAWVLFNSFFLHDDVSPAPAGLAFVAGLLGNLLLALRYRAARATSALIAGDLGCNILLPFVPAAFAGGTASPLLAVVAVNLATYAALFPTRTFTAAAITASACVFLLAVCESVAILPPAAAASFAAAWRIVLPLLLVAAPTILWRLRRRAPPPRPVAGTASPTTPSTPGGGDADSVSGVVANALLAVSDVVSRLTQLDEILEKVAEVAPRSLGVDFCGIVLWNEDTGTYTGSVAAGATPDVNRRFSGMQWSPEQAPEFEWARRLGKSTIAQAPEGSQTAAPDIPAILISPLTSGETFFGVIQFARRGTGLPFTQRDFSIADGIARQTAVALERARLLEGSRMLVRALESTGEAVLITDVEHRILFANPAFLRTFAYELGAVIGKHAEDLAGAGADWLAGLDPNATPPGWRGETTLCDSHGTRIPVLADVSPIAAAGQPAQGAVVTLKDISAEKAFQEQMLRADRLAAVGGLAAGLAHEINNALTAIFGQTRNRDRIAGEELRHALGRVDAQAERIAGIVQDVLGFAHPRPPQPQTGPIADVVRHSVELLRHDYSRQGIAIEVDVAADLPEARFDAAQIQQVLLNLLGNALQILSGQPDGRVRVDVAATAQGIVLDVSDNGPGIPTENLARIFDPFFSTRPEGTGLGLSVSYAIAQSHGGDLRAANRAGGGARFTLVLPAAPTSGELGVRRALVVDDDPEVAESLSEMIEREGVTVARAATAAAALEALADGEWGAVFLDVRLPDRPGTDVFEHLARHRPELAERVVFVTGGLWRTESKLREELPGRHVLAKPCTPEQVRDVLLTLAAEAARASDRSSAAP